MEKMKKDLQAKLDKLKADWKKDSVITFEQLGIEMNFMRGNRPWNWNVSPRRESTRRLTLPR